ncbi:hypothetical protein LWI29_013739 [Acer saccharum]|uniref:CCHC-type domain-containing protein n=1 Tax=Acer saccharum TaxID=4024 RepID=A0AA39RKR9_ACESA|nr:hypothetical protein LWI29_013739 [Acer saccharum]
MLEMIKVNKVAFEDLMNVGPERWSRAYSPVPRYCLMSSIAESMNSCLVHARQMPITTMVEYIREMIQKWFAKKPFVDFCGDCYKTTSWVEAYSRNIFPIGHPSEWNTPEDVRSRVVYPPHFRAQAGRLKKKRYKSVGEYRNGKTRNCTICGKSGHNRQNCRNAQPCQIPIPSATSATSATSKRPRRPYRCRKCGEECHNSQKCPLTPELKTELGWWVSRRRVSSTEGRRSLMGDGRRLSAISMARVTTVRDGDLDWATNGDYRRLSAISTARVVTARDSDLDWATDGDQLSAI